MCMQFLHYSDYTYYGRTLLGAHAAASLLRLLLPRDGLVDRYDAVPLPAAADAATDLVPTLEDALQQRLRRHALPGQHS